MRLLFDENISYRIVKKLKPPLFNCLHASEIATTPVLSDLKIWTYAKVNRYTIVTFDEDFRDLSNLHSFPPKVILLKTGNCSTGYIADLIVDRIEEIIYFQDSTLHGLLEIV